VDSHCHVLRPTRVPAAAQRCAYGGWPGGRRAWPGAGRWPRGGSAARAV